MQCRGYSGDPARIIPTNACLPRVPFAQRRSVLERHPAPLPCFPPMLPPAMNSNYPGSRGSPPGSLDDGNYGALWSPPPPRRFLLDAIVPDQSTGAGLGALAAAAAVMDGAERAAPAAAPQLLVSLPTTQGDDEALHPLCRVGAAAAASTAGSTTPSPLPANTAAGRGPVARVGAARPTGPAIGATSQHCNAPGLATSGSRRVMATPPPPSHTTRGLRVSAGAATLQVPPPAGVRAGAVGSTALQSMSSPYSASAPPAFSSNPGARLASPPSRSLFHTVQLPPRRQVNGAAARSTAAQRKTPATSALGKRAQPAASKSAGKASATRKSPSGKKPQTALQKEVMEAVKVGISPFQMGLDRVEKKVAAITGTLDDLYDRVDRRSEGDEVAAQSMAKFESAINNGIEKAMKSVTTLAASSTTQLAENKNSTTAELSAKAKMDLALSNKRDMEAVRSAFEAAVNDNSGGATVSRQAYVDTLAAWELMCSAAESVLKLGAKDAESYLLSTRIFPASAGTSVKSCTVSSWFTNSVPHKMDKYRKVVLKAYFTSLKRDWRTLGAADAGAWLLRNVYRTSTQGKCAIKVALKAFFKSTGHTGRIVAANSVGEDGHLACVLGQVSLVCAAVRWHLEVRTGKRASGHHGNSQTFHALWRDETNAIDLSFPLHNRAANGILLIDGADVRRTHTFSEEVVSAHVPVAAGGAMQQDGGPSNGDDADAAPNAEDGTDDGFTDDGDSQAHNGGDADAVDGAGFLAASSTGLELGAQAPDDGNDAELLAPDSDDEDDEEDGGGIDLQFTAGNEV